jgi:serine/threonine protein phosphatase PrpC
MAGSESETPDTSRILRGRDNRLFGALAVAEIGRSLAVAMTAAVVTTSATSENEDVGAVVSGPRANLLVIADGHFGSSASEIAVERVLATIGDDPPPADLSDDEVVSIFVEAEIAVQRETTQVGSSHPNSRTTLALALVTEDIVQWAALGDSCVVAAAPSAGSRLDAPRSAYLGSRFSVADVAAVLTRGRFPRRRDDWIVLATDGFTDSVGSEQDAGAVVCSELRNHEEAAALAEELIALAIRHRAEDAVTIAVAAPQLGSTA